MGLARQWNGFVCPDCRLVFRVPSGNAGGGIVCFNCKRLLRIPSSDDISPILMLPKVKPKKSTEDLLTQETPQIAKKRLHHKSKENEIDDHSWETETFSSRKRSNNSSWKGVAFGTSVLGLLLALGGILLFMKKDEKPPTLAEKVAPTPPLIASDLNEKSQVNAEAVAIKAEPMVRKFLSAKSIDEILPLVRNPQIVASRMKSFYPDGKIKPFDISSYNILGTADSRDDFVAIWVQDRNYEEQSVALIATAEGYKIDWESWVGWSEMSADEFMAKKPEVPHIFRVTLSAVKYYNFDFQDDSKWTSYRIEFPNKNEFSIYCYVEKGSILNQRIQLQKDEKKAKVMISLKYPPGATRNDQVLVHDLLYRGWVEGMKLE